MTVLFLQLFCFLLRHSESHCFAVTNYHLGRECNSVYRRSRLKGCHFKQRVYSYVKGARIWDVSLFVAVSRNAQPM
jgi:hypothetical protein